MSLLVWLPFDGNSNNYGLTQTTITPTGGNIVYAAGKIGQGLSCNGSTYFTVSPITLSSNASICCWKKTTVGAKMSWVLNSDASNKLNIYEAASGYTLNTGDGSNNLFKNASGQAIAVIKDGLWHHFAITFGNSVAKLYIDGAYQGTAMTFRDPATTNKEIKIAGGYNNAHSYDWNGMINDFRIYDHCLSVQEVKEIAKGLILHYPLTHRNMGQNNLFCIDKVTKQSSSNTTVTKKNSTITLTCGKVNYGAFRSLPSEESFSFEAGTTYTVSGHIKVISKGSDNCNPRLCIRNSSNTIQAQATMTATEGDVSFSLTPSTTFNGYVCGINTWSSGSNNTGTAQTEFSNIKLEIGTVKTAYAPNSTDALYTQMNLGNNVEYDISGYNHNGTRIGSLIYDSNNPKYGISTYIANGLNDRVLTPVLNMPTDTITINVWFKSTNTTPTGNYHIILDSVGIGDNSDNGRQWYEMAVYKTGYFRGGLFVNGVRKTDNCTSTTCLNGNWHMLTMTYDGTAVKRYFDGILEKSTSAVITTGLATPTALMIGRDGPTTSYACKEVCLSDLRIYATALSAQDILSLYHNNAYIDTSGHIYGAIH